jgi:hypothetical protein
MNVRTRTLRTGLAGALAVTALAAMPAGAAEDPADYSWIATIRCGHGPIKVGSGDDMWAPLVALKSGRKYRPVAWNLKAGDKVIRERKSGTGKRRTMKCRYRDDVAHGTVTVLKRTT